MVRRTVLKAGKRWLILGHRWLGIGTGLLLALWIASGLVMLHVPFPRLTEPERLARLPSIDWDRVRLAPEAAFAAGGLAGQPAALVLEMRADEPVYRMAAPDGTPVTVSARTGERLGPVSPTEALRIAGAEPAHASSEPIERDQWTVTARFDRFRPFRKIALDDAAGTDLYVSVPAGEIVLDTSRFERGWNWVGAVVHWVYLTPLRARPELWRAVVLWLSGAACLTALSGLTTGLWRIRLRRPYRDGASPYRGAARWHHLFGVTAGVGLCTFIVSGWLSMNPNRWFTALVPPAAWLEAYAGSPASLAAAPGGLRAMASPGAVSLRFTRIGGRWFVTDQGSDGARTLGLDDGAAPKQVSQECPTVRRQKPAANQGPEQVKRWPANANLLSEAAIVSAVAAALPGLGPARLERLEGYDAYWYPNPEPPALPVLRFRFADPDATWLHVDPASGAILNRLDRSGRVNRWLFSGLHRLDVSMLGTHPSARLALQWTLNLLAGVIAVTGLLMGWRRLSRRSARR